MKMWKKLAAALLAAALAMAMLTACGGEATIVVDEEQAKNTTTWVQEAMRDEGYELTVDAALSPMIKGGLPKAVAYRTAQNEGKDAQTVQTAYNDLCATLDLNFARTEKKGYVFVALQGKGAIQEKNIKSYIKSNKQNMLKQLKEKGVENPASVAAGVATQGERHFILLIISE